jgi:NAD(P)-dependent dehydrogenase (short-subunit alcohol dehydrogenase family)
VPADEISGLMQTPLWGIGRTMALELPAIFGGLIDLPAGSSPSVADVAMTIGPMLGARIDTQYAVRDGGLYRPRLRASAPSPDRGPLVRSDASYLVTGGFGSLGLAFARWLVGEGAREIWLLGRRGAPDPAAAADLVALQSTATIRTAAVDLADPGALERQLSEWGALGLPLGGVIHAAGLNGRSALGKLDWPHTADLLAAKVQGTWALAHAVGEQNLDFFIACSSIAALWGGQQQAAYSAANAFLDGFAHYRKARGKPALSLALGPIAGSAMLDDDAAAALRRIGLGAIPFARLTAELPRLVADGAPHLAFVDADFEQFAGLHAARSPTDLFADLRRQAVKPFDSPPVSPADPHEPLSPEELTSWLARQVTAALRLPHQLIDGDAPLPQLGLDSLIAVELRNRIQQRLGVAVPLLDLLGDLGVNALAQRLTGARADGLQGSTRAIAEDWIGGEI